MIVWIPIVILVFICLISAIVIESRKEKELLSVESISIVSKNVSSTNCFVFLSYLHDKEFGDGNSRLITEIEHIKPDAILIGGDTMNVRQGKIGLEVTERLLSGLSKIAPVYYGNGNNEQRLTWEQEDFEEYKIGFLELLKKYNVYYLNDTACDIGRIRIYGLNLELEHYHELWNKKLTVKFIENAIGKADKKKFNLLLCHSPMFIDTYAEWGADLVLTGHSHGGVIRFPTDRKKEAGKINNDRGLISGQYQLFHKYCAGVFWKDKTCMIISRGLGTHTVNVRINNLPQLVVINII